MEVSPPLYATNKQQHRRASFGAGCWTLFSMQTIFFPIVSSCFKSLILRHRGCMGTDSRPPDWVVLVCLINIGTCTQWDAQINCAQVPPLIKQTCNEPIKKGCCHYLYSCTHGANMDSSAVELATLRAPLVPRGSRTWVHFICTTMNQFKLENNSNCLLPF